LAGSKFFIKLHPNVLVPPAVARDIAPTIPELPGWLLVRSLANPRQPQMVNGSIGPGEHEVISLGLEVGAERVILDEQPARRLATSLGLRVIGTVGLLLSAKDRGFLAKIKPELDRLLALGLFMGQELYDRAIGQAGECTVKLPRSGLQARGGRGRPVSEWRVIRAEAALQVPRTPFQPIPEYPAEPCPGIQ
jgi:predicted nucleic acid-binding protein